MYLCVCNSITKDQVIEDLKKGLTEDEITEKRGIADNCSACESPFDELVSTLNPDNFRE
jgi:bacterioferritin-associated ferredoxin|tara:strand:+ start:519 stop:695 length:177 start_codon:yes stop_codon:yes gene_type:complete